MTVSKEIIAQQQQQNDGCQICSMTRHMSSKQKPLFSPCSLSTECSEIWKKVLFPPLLETKSTGGGEGDGFPLEFHSILISNWAIHLYDQLVVGFLHKTFSPFGTKEEKDVNKCPQKQTTILRKKKKRKKISPASIDPVLTHHSPSFHFDSTETNKRREDEKTIDVTVVATGVATETQDIPPTKAQTGSSTDHVVERKANQPTNDEMTDSISSLTSSDSTNDLDDGGRALKRQMADAIDGSVCGRKKKTCVGKPVIRQLLEQKANELGVQVGDYVEFQTGDKKVILQCNSAPQKQHSPPSSPSSPIKSPLSAPKEDGDYQTLGRQDFAWEFNVPGSEMKLSGLTRFLSTQLNYCHGVSRNKSVIRSMKKVKMTREPDDICSTQTNTEMPSLIQQQQIINESNSNFSHKTETDEMKKNQSNHFQSSNETSFRINQNHDPNHVVDHETKTTTQTAAQIDSIHHILPHQTFLLQTQCSQGLEFYRLVKVVQELKSRQRPISPLCQQHVPSACQQHTSLQQQKQQPIAAAAASHKIPCSLCMYNVHETQYCPLRWCSLCRNYGHGPGPDCFLYVSARTTVEFAKTYLPKDNNTQHFPGYDQHFDDRHHCQDHHQQHQTRSVDANFKQTCFENENSPSWIIDNTKSNEGHPTQQQEQQKEQQQEQQRYGTKKNTTQWPRSNHHNPIRKRGGAYFSKNDRDSSNANGKRFQENEDNGRWRRGQPVVDHRFNDERFLIKDYFPSFQRSRMNGDNMNG